MNKIYQVCTSVYAKGMVVLMSLCLGSVFAGPIIIDHSAVELYDDIPQPYIAWIKTQWLDVPGESHSLGYRLGLQLVENFSTNYDVNVKDSGTPEGSTNAYLRVSRASWGDVSNATGWRYSYGEEDWYTSSQAVARTLAFLSYANTNGRPIASVGFGWCWDTTWQNVPGGTVDPVHQVRWAGASVGGPDGSLRWGLDAEDTALTGNRVCLDTYLAATQAYSDYCRMKGFVTRVFFTTSPVDGYSGENGYQRHLKHERIRQYVAATTNECLFDYADILSWSDAGTQNLPVWTDFAGAEKSYQMIHADNMLDLDGTYTEDGDHIGRRGALRLGKALWVLMARLAGWEPDRAPGASLVLSLTAGCFDIRFPTYPLYTYTLMRSDDLELWEAVPGAVLVGTGHEASFTVSHEEASRRFWKVVPQAP